MSSGGSGHSRLESLNRKSSATTGKPKAGLKFKPKVVARRSEKDRASDAPVIKDESKFDSKGKNFRGGRGGRGGARGRGGRGGMRGGRGMVKTEMISSGPLSSATFTDSGLGSTMIHSLSPTPEYFQSIRKEARSRSATAGAESDDEDSSKIDMDTDLNVGEEDAFTSLFPIRPQQFSKLSEDYSDEASNINNPMEVRSVSPESNSGDESAKQTVEDVDDLDAEDSELQLLAENIQIMKLVEAYSKTDKSNAGINEESDDSEKKDKEKLASKSLKKPNEEFMLLQLPNFLPEFKSSDDMDIDEQTSKEDLIKKAATQKGKIGTLKVHKSGKVIMQIGDIALDIVKSPTIGFLQDIVLCDLPKPKLKESKRVEGDNEEDQEPKKQEANMFQLGQVGHKLVTIPHIMD